MRDKAGFFAGLADLLTEMCIYYVIAGIFIMSSRGWGLHLFWLLFLPTIFAFLFFLLLRKPRTTPVLTAFIVVMLAVEIVVFLLASSTGPTFGYIFVLAIGAGMGAGLPLYYGLKRPDVHWHLTHLDLLIMALLVILLCRQAMDIDIGTVALMIIVLFMDAAGAVCLRMTDGNGVGIDGKNAFQGSLIALGAAAIVLVVVSLLTVLFSRSNNVTGRILHGISSFFAAIGSGMERFFRWFAGLFNGQETFDTVPLEGEIPSVADVEQAGGSVSLSINPVVVGIILCVVIAAVIVILTLLFRKKSFSRKAKTVSASSAVAVSRTGGGLSALWKKLRQALQFRWIAFVMRNTPGGLLVILERMGKRQHTPRGTGESMRSFIRRMDNSGGLDTLADALDREFYGDMADTMSPGECRALKRYMRKAVHHG